MLSRKMLNKIKRTRFPSPNFLNEALMSIIAFLKLKVHKILLEAIELSLNSFVISTLITSCFIPWKASDFRIYLKARCAIRIKGSKLTILTMQLV